MNRSRAALTAGLLVPFFSCSSAAPPPGAIVLGGFNLTGALDSSTCPFDANQDGGLIDLRPEGQERTVLPISGEAHNGDYGRPGEIGVARLLVDGGGLSPATLDITWTLSMTPEQRILYLSNGVTQLQGAVTGSSFLMEQTALRSVCGNAWLDERLSGSFYGPPQPLLPDAGCLLLVGPGRFADGGIWSLDGDGGAASPCFAPGGLLPGARLSDEFSLLADAGTDGGNLCAPDAGIVESCATTYSMQGGVTP